MSAINYSRKDPGYDERSINLRKHHISLRDHQDPSEMYNRLLAVSKTMGITIPPTIELVQVEGKPDQWTGELADILKFIIDHFGFMPMDEISYAFELSAALKLANPIPHFNAFNQRYVGQVLGLYQHYFKTQYDKWLASRRQEELDNQPPPPKLPSEQINEMAYDSLKDFIRNQGTFPMIYSWGPAYLHADSKGYIKLTKEEKVAMFKTQLEAVKQENKLARLGKNSDRSINVLDEEGEESAAITRCQKIGLKSHFEVIFGKEIPDWKLGGQPKMNL